MLAIVCEVIGTLSIKEATISNNYIWYLFIAFMYIASFSFVYYAAKFIEIGTVYAIWSGMGTALIVILGWLIFKEDINIYKIISGFSL